MVCGVGCLEAFCGAWVSSNPGIDDS
ncbi:UNVERIFIED_ORG: hypothetical protein L601_006900000060, partial [Gordonia westfalica J30]